MLIIILQLSFFPPFILAWCWIGHNSLCQLIDLETKGKKISVYVLGAGELTS